MTNEHEVLGSLETALPVVLSNVLVLPPPQESVRVESGPTTALIEVKAEHRAEVAIPRELVGVVQNHLENFLSDRTREAYVSDWRDFFAWMTTSGLNVQALSRVTESHIIGYRNFLREKYSPTSINKKAFCTLLPLCEIEGRANCPLEPRRGVETSQSHRQEKAHRVHRPGGESAFGFDWD